MRFRPLIAAFLAICLFLVSACSGNTQAKTRENLTYAEIHNTGLANSCFDVDEAARGMIALDPDARYRLTDLCLHPSEVQVKTRPANSRQEPTFVAGKILTRYTSSLDEVYGDLEIGSDGLTFSEKGGIDFQLITVLLPGGEEVPFVFSSKDLVATSANDAISTSTDFEGGYRVPSYRTSNFLDPKGRGLTTGYGSAVGLVPAGDDEELAQENIKRYLEGSGTMKLSISRVDPDTNEFAGFFIAQQTSDTDMGSKDPYDLQISGEFYGRLDRG